MSGFPRTIWSPVGAAGIVVPTGVTSSVNASSTLTYLQVKERALRLKQQYTENNVTLPPNGDLALHIADCVAISDLWLLARGTGISAQQIFRSVQLDRISRAADSILDLDARRQYLRDMVSARVDVFDRTPSKAKDVLWEMELCGIFNRHGVGARLAEPDIVLSVLNSDIGVACKKFYSEENVESTLSRGVSQIEREHQFGILGINLDDVGPANCVRVANSEDVLGRSLTAENFAFLSRHERHFRRYLSTGRVMGALVASGGVCVIAEMPTTARQCTLWVIPGLESAKARLMDELQRKLTYNGMAP